MIDLSSAPERAQKLLHRLRHGCIASSKLTSNGASITAGPSQLRDATLQGAEALVRAALTPADPGSGGYQVMYPPFYLSLCLLSWLSHGPVPISPWVLASALIHVFS